MTAPFSFKNPSGSFRGIGHIAAEEPPPFLLLPIRMSWGLDSHQPFALPICFCLPAAWDLLSSWGLHCSHAAQASPVTLQVPQTTANGLGKLQRATALSVLQQTAHGSHDLHQPFIRNHEPERFIMRLPAASGPINSRTNNLCTQPTACTHLHTLLTTIFDCLCSDPYTPSKICMFLEHAASKTSWCAHFYINILKYQVSLNSKS